MSLLDTNDVSVVWEWHDGSYDRARFQASDAGCTVSGRHGDTRYLIRVDRDFACRSLEVSHGVKTRTLNRTKAGWLTAQGTMISNSANCVDLDLGWTALTNTFPIRRLIAQRQTFGTFSVLLISLPDLTARPVSQSYSQNENGWLYQNVESGYSAQLSVDRYGLVTDYPGLCTRKDLGP
ncbi:MAG: putative glycolipid-binding domain-containing protein [Pseudomonadota bacterium]